jgi:hypothetical protein
MVSLAARRDLVAVVDERGLSATSLTLAPGSCVGALSFRI